MLDKFDEEIIGQDSSKGEESESYSKTPSKVTVMKTIFKLIPIIINLKRDRKEWVRKEGENVDERKFRRHAQKALKVFISLGPSYIKLGQWLSSRPDILPQPYLDVLSKLQDEVPPSPFSEIHKIIEKELGKLDDNFESFEESAISGASLGQVYLAIYNGKRVIVKVSRPDIEGIISKDIYILKKLLPLASRFIDQNLRYSAEGMLSQFIETINEEMDYRIESQNLIEIKNNLKSERSVIIPKIYPERTSKHVITMEYVPGIKITDIESLNKAGIDRSKLVVKIHRIFFKMLLRHRIFHADPHPGNISVTDNGLIILYDFGMVGKLNDETRIKLIRLYMGLIDKDPVRTTDVLIELGTLEPTVDRMLVERGLDLSIRSLHGKKVDTMEVRALQDLANKTLSRFPFRLPKNLALYMRMASILEGIYIHHKVNFQFVKVLSNLLEEEGLLKEAYIEEIKVTFARFAKGIQASSEVVPMFRQYLNEVHENRLNKTNNYMLPATVFSSAIFVGSSIIFPHDVFFSYVGFTISGLIMSFIIFNKLRRG